MSEIVLVAAIGNNHEIGKGNQLLWHLPEDLKHFRTITTGHTVIMGRKTFDSLGKPLPNRVNWVVTRNPNWNHPGVRAFTDLHAAIEACQEEVCMILGGAEIYRQALPLADRMELTHVKGDFDADAFFPVFSIEEWQVESTKKGQDERSGLSYEFCSWIRKRL
jgi:dihydrofolate reductase